ncbi:class I SAM-dependent methyltransferase [Lentzea sp.]|uniref:class I SAM-dependent methyltransferase n=1 Tax=Lentzea sp. TaxID=56099 RepID=UPI002BB257B9|nr:class I SAM-dependent methyltransferase [Lentzea sp.]HUQ54082.1 class I SAM-dependent methyltransferase [Lentzea sp.]
MENYYSKGFAAFFDSNYTGWVNRFSPRLAAALGTSPDLPRTALDLCCGTGITTAYFLAEGWQVSGVDGSDAMLALNRARNSDAHDEGRLSLTTADARTFKLAEPVAAAFSLDGALNHLPTLAELQRCFERVHEALLPHGEFVFDLFEQSHFEHWNHVTVTDKPEAVVVKRGVWDTSARRGMLRVSGVFGDGDDAQRVEQSLSSTYYDADEVNGALRDAGFEPRPHDFAGPDLKCDSGSCSMTSVPCRQVYRAVRAG